MIGYFFIISLQAYLGIKYQTVAHWMIQSIILILTVIQLIIDINNYPSYVELGYSAPLSTLIFFQSSVALWLLLTLLLINFITKKLISFCS